MKNDLTNFGVSRRDFLQIAGIGVGGVLTGCKSFSAGLRCNHHPNVIFVFADQWRAQATGYFGNSDVQTPFLDQLEKESLNFTNAVSNCSVCCPYRASLLTGQYPLTHGVFLNDLRLNDQAPSIAEVCKQSGYQTAYIGKWHLDGSGRDAYIPEERRQGFDYWKALECTHDYYQSTYYTGNDSQKKVWPGYDADAQTADAVNYLKDQADTNRPFLLFLSWGGPHSPYAASPADLKAEYESQVLALRPNIPEDKQADARQALNGYYAHCTALDQNMGRLIECLEATGLHENTIVVFTSDHGDMLFSHGGRNKQQPYDESVLVPLLVRCPSSWGRQPRRIHMPIGTPDIMPTLLGLCGLNIPDSVEGEDFSGLILEKQPDQDRAVLITCPVPFGQWSPDQGGQEYRGVRTQQYTYVRSLDGDWLLFDNLKDPGQLNNLIKDPVYTQLRDALKEKLDALLKQTGDDFATATELLQRAGYQVNRRNTIEYKDAEFFGQVSVNCSVSQNEFESVEREKGVKNEN